MVVVICTFSGLCSQHSAVRHHWGQLSRYAFFQVFHFICLSSENFQVRISMASVVNISVSSSCSQTLREQLSPNTSKCPTLLKTSQDLIVITHTLYQSALSLPSLPSPLLPTPSPPLPLSCSPLTSAPLSPLLPSHSALSLLLFNFNCRRPLTM